MKIPGGWVGWVGWKDWTAEWFGSYFLSDYKVIVNELLDEVVEMRCRRGVAVRRSVHGTSATGIKAD
jgi:hypothetical protein